MDVVADEVEQKGFARPVFPSYLPSGMSPEPRVFQTYPNQISTQFIAGGSPNYSTGAYPFDLDIEQWVPLASPAGERSPTEGRVDIAGHQGRLTVTRGENTGLTELDYRVSFYDEFDFLLTLSWKVPAATPTEVLDAELRQEIVRIAESMIR